MSVVTSPQGVYAPSVQVWEVATGKRITTYIGHNPAPGHSNTGPYEIEWSPDSTRVVSAGVYDKTAQIWDPKTGKTIITYRGHAHTVWRARWSPNGKYIASASSGDTLDGSSTSSRYETKSDNIQTRDTLSNIFDPVNGAQER